MSRPLLFSLLVLTTLASGCASSDGNGQNATPSAKLSHAVGLSAPPPIPVLHYSRNPEQRVMSPSFQSHKVLFVSSYANSEVDAYDLSAGGFPVVERITQGIVNPAGLNLDSAGNVYVANQGGGTVTMYQPGSLTPALTLTGFSQPMDVTSDKWRNVYVIDRGTPASIDIFAPGQTTPSQVITGSLIQQPQQIEVDSNGTMFVSDNVSGAYTIAKNSSTPSSLSIAGLPNNWAAGLAIDPKIGALFLSCNKGPTDYLASFLPFDPSAFQVFAVPDYNFLAFDNDGFLYGVDWATGNAAVYTPYHTKPVQTFTVVGNPNGVTVKPKNIP